MADIVEQALRRLARQLFEAEERLDPSYELGWDELTEFERDYFYFAIKRVLDYREDVLAAIEAADELTDLRAERARIIELLRSDEARKFVGRAIKDNAIDPDSIEEHYFAVAALDAMIELIERR